MATIDRFVEDRRARWSRLGQLVQNARGRVARLDGEEVLELGRLYRSATSDLAVARRDFADDAATERLNDVVTTVRVAIVAFPGGLTAAALTPYVLGSNGAFLGTVLAVVQGYGLSGGLLSFTAAHGPLEISCIVLSGGAGLRLAWALLRPGDRSRRDAARLAGAQAVRVMFVVVPALGVAGLLEGFLSPSDAPLAIKIAAGLVAGTLLWGYILLGGRSFKRSAA